MRPLGLGKKCTPIYRYYRGRYHKQLSGRLLMTVLKRVSLKQYLDCVFKPCGISNVLAANVEFAIK